MTKARLNVVPAAQPKSIGKRPAASSLDPDLLDSLIRAKARIDDALFELEGAEGEFYALSDQLNDSLPDTLNVDSDWRGETLSITVTARIDVKPNGETVQGVPAGNAFEDLLARYTGLSGGCKPPKEGGADE